MAEREDRADAKPRRVDADRLNALVQTLAILAAGAWGVYTFVYEARIKPSFEPPSVSVTTNLVRAGERGDHVAIRSTVTRKNVGQASVRVLGLAYNVIGVRVRFGEGADGAGAERIEDRDAVTAARSYRLDEPGTVILRQGVLFAGATEQAAEPSDLNPGEAVSRDLIVYADRTKYDFVRFEVSLAYAREDDPPVRLRFETAHDGSLALKPRADCTGPAQTCAALKTTEFGTAFSLW